MDALPIHRTNPQRLSVARRALAFAAGAPRKLVHRLAHWKKFKLAGSPTETATNSPSAAFKAGRSTDTSFQGSATLKGCRPGIPGVRRPGVVWFRSDLRMHDNQALSRAVSECSSVLPVYCFDPRDYGRSPHGYDRTGPYRATFLLQAVADLRGRLRAAGSDLVVRLGRPEDVVSELAHRIGAAAVYCHSEVTYEGQQVERRVAEAVQASGGTAFNTFWTNTLHRVEDLPFKLADMPQNFDQFKERVSGIVAQRPLQVPERIPGMPIGASLAVDAGELPTLKKLGLEPLPVQSSNESCVGGESEALRQLRAFLSFSGKPTIQGAPAAPPGAATANSFASSIAPWLATGCLSPRRMLQDAKAVLLETDEKTNIHADQRQSGGAGLQWIEFELLWRDFFRLLTRRHSEVVLPKAQHAAAALEIASPALALA